jgi:hydrogenase nickel incorporation protein HypB
MDTERIDVQQSIYDKNDRIAADLNSKMTQKGTLLINVMGAPGVGKTSVIRKAVAGLAQKCAVIEGDIESDIDTRALAAIGIPTYQINTHGACHLDAPTLSDAVEGFNTPDEGVVFIENIGNLVCPAEFSIGEHAKMLIVTVTDGSDKPYKYPLAFEKADIIVLNKADLAPFVEFDEQFFMAGVRALNPGVPVVKVSAKDGSGMDEIIQWIKEKKKTVKA